MNSIVMNWFWFSASFVTFGLLIASWRRWHRGGDRRDPDPKLPRTGDGSRGARPDGQSDMPSRGIDPVSGERLDMDTALPWFHRGRIYFFAGEATRSCFAARTCSSARGGTASSRVIHSAPGARRTRTSHVEKRP